MLDSRFLLGTAVLMVGAYFDLRHRQNIPTWLLYGALGAAIGINLSLPPLLLIASLMSGWAVWLAFQWMHRLGHVGGAEPELFAFLAMLRPLNFVLVLFVMAGWLLAGLIRQRFKPSKAKVPLIPYLLLGWLLTALLLG